MNFYEHVKFITLKEGRNAMHECVKRCALFDDQGKINTFGYYKYIYFKHSILTYKITPGKAVNISYHGDVEFIFKINRTFLTVHYRVTPTSLNTFMHCIPTFL
jgi:hypothetical protein